jgi:hypothetical protein
MMRTSETFRYSGIDGSLRCESNTIRVMSNLEGDDLAKKKRKKSTARRLPTAAALAPQCDHLDLVMQLRLISLGGIHCCEALV